ncbi:Heavy metal transport/detoxification superfamily protein [Raphanus sativus]|uniref:Heavy metal-associated isoprenylated plant protein 6-like n=1 Tax=Raphanus sativus TaxID=3726 RepID=A0A6J0KAV1_RAPSA|nr:heavy metal-associated isoprenylated plant protein 6-like [Raphanus sativus]KAJ4882347.1 Heavy metal transport/detoxification superfamily protein [Raphanus sativus]
MVENKEETVATIPEGEKNGGGGATVVVMKLDLHCQGCGKKIKRLLKHHKGVEDVKIDYKADKLTVIGYVDPTAVRDKVADRIKRTVEIVSAVAPKKEAPPPPPPPSPPSGGEKKAADDEKKKDEAEQKTPSPPEESSTVVLKMKLHCQGCEHKIKRIVNKINGVHSVAIDSAKDFVIVKGIIDVKQLTPYLNEKLKRKVEVVPAKKEEGSPVEAAAAAPASGEKKDKGVAGEKKETKDVGVKDGGGEKKKEAAPAGGGDGGATVDVKKSEYSGYGYPPQPMYYYYPPGQVYGQHYMMQGQSSSQAYVQEPYTNQGYVHEYYTNQRYGQQQGYGQEAPPPPQQPYMNYQGYADPYDPYAHMRAPDMFSDENPNGCSVM